MAPKKKDPKASKKPSEARRLAGIAAAKELKKKDPDHFKKIGMRGRCAPARGCPRTDPGPTLGYVGQRCGEIVTPQGREASCYEVRPADTLITSHDPGTWAPDPRYPQLVQERDYRGDKNEQLKVEKIAARPDPAIVLSNSPTPVDGPPVITNAGIVLGGNGRTMGIKLAYSRGTADQYRAELLARAPLFGLDAKQIEGITDPILVRNVAALDQASQPEMAAASAVLNEGLTNTLDERARAVSLSRRLSPETLAAIGDLLEQHETLRAAMAANPTRFIERLREDGIFTAQNNAANVAGGELTEAGKQVVEGAFLGLVVGTPERLKAAPPSALLRLERLIPALARVAGRGKTHDLIPLFQTGLDLLIASAAAGLTPRQYAAQGDLTRKAGWSEKEVQAAEVLTQPVKVVSEAAKAWVKLADHDPRQASMFGAPSTPAQAWAAMVEVALVGSPVEFSARVRKVAAAVVASEAYKRAHMEVALLSDVAARLDPPLDPGEFTAQITRSKEGNLLALSHIETAKMKPETATRAAKFELPGGLNAVSPKAPVPVAVVPLALVVPITKNKGKKVKTSPPPAMEVDPVVVPAPVVAPVVEPVQLTSQEFYDLNRVPATLAPLNPAFVEWMKARFMEIGRSAGFPETTAGKDAFEVIHPAGEKLTANVDRDGFIGIEFKYRTSDLDAPGLKPNRLFALALAANGFAVKAYSARESPNGNWYTRLLSVNLESALKAWLMSGAGTTPPDWRPTEVLAEDVMAATTVGSSTPAIVPAAVVPLPAPAAVVGTIEKESPVTTAAQMRANLARVDLEHLGSQSGVITYLDVTPGFEEWVRNRVLLAASLAGIQPFNPPDFQFSAAGRVAVADGIRIPKTRGGVAFSLDFPSLKDKEKIKAFQKEWKKALSNAGFDVLYMASIETRNPDRLQSSTTVDLVEAIELLESEIAPEIPEVISEVKPDSISETQGRKSETAVTPVSSDLGGGAVLAEPSPMKTETPTKAKFIEKWLIDELELKVWTGGAARRIYLKDFGPILYGLQVTRYGTGNISSAKLDGEKISNSRAYPMVSKLEKAYFDCVSGQVVCDLGADVIQETLESKVKEWPPYLEAIQQTPPVAPVLPTPPAPIALTVPAVMLAAQNPAVQRFGRFKVFIGSLWEHMGPAAGTLEQFKAWLLAEHQVGHLVLSRADMVELMDPKMVALSEIQYLRSTFHFLDLE